MNAAAAERYALIAGNGQLALSGVEGFPQHMPGQTKRGLAAGSSSVAPATGKEETP